MIKYKFSFEYLDDFNMVVLDFSEEKSLEFANMISDPLGSDIPWRYNDLKVDIDQYIDLLKGNISKYTHGGNASSVISYRDYTIIEDPFYDEEEEIEPVCKLETIEFVKIILAWANETYKFKSKKGVITLEEAESVMKWIEQKVIEVNNIKVNE